MWWLWFFVVFFMCLFLIGFRFVITQQELDQSRLDQGNALLHETQGMGMPTDTVQTQAQELTDTTHQVHDLQTKMLDLERAIDAEAQRLSMLGQHKKDELEDILQGHARQFQEGLQAWREDLVTGLQTSRGRVRDLKNIHGGLMSYTNNMETAQVVNKDTLATLQGHKRRLEWIKDALGAIEGEVSAAEELSHKTERLLYETRNMSAEQYKTLTHTVLKFQDRLPQFDALLSLQSQQLQDIQDHVTHLTSTRETCKALLQGGTTPMLDSVRVLSEDVGDYTRKSKDLLGIHAAKLDGLELDGGVIKWRDQLRRMELQVVKAEQRVGEYDAKRDWKELGRVDEVLGIHKSTAQAFKAGVEGAVMCQDGQCGMARGTSLCVDEACATPNEIQDVMDRSGLRLDRDLVLFVESALVAKGTVLQDQSGKGRHFKLSSKDILPVNVLGSAANALRVSETCQATGPGLPLDNEYTVIVVCKPKAKASTAPFLMLDSTPEHTYWIPNAFQEVACGSAKYRGVKTRVNPKHYAFRLTKAGRDIFENGTWMAASKAPVTTLVSKSPDNKTQLWPGAWAGDSYCVLVYARALKDPEIRANFELLRYRYNIPIGDTLVRKTDLGTYQLPHDAYIQVLQMNQYTVSPPTTLDRYAVIQNPMNNVDVIGSTVKVRGDYRNASYTVVIGGYREDDLVVEYTVQFTEPDKPAQATVKSGKDIPKITLTEDIPSFPLVLGSLFNNPANLQLKYTVDGGEAQSTFVVRWLGSSQVKTSTVVAIDRFGRRTEVTFTATHASPNPVHCLVGTFGPYSACSASCGGGIQTRTRPVLRRDAHGGNPCPSTSESVPCNTQPCGF